MGRKTQLTIVFDHDSSTVGIEAHGIPGCLAQMMLDEAVRMLNIQRRAAAAMEMRQQMADQALAASITGGVRHRG